MAKRPNVRHLERHARRAIADRLRYSAPEALRAVERDGHDVILRLNSGGNACAVDLWLDSQGYEVSDDGGNPDGFGCALRVHGR